VLRIHFTGDDLRRTTVATEADPLWEVVLSGFLLHERHPPAYLRPWRRLIRADAPRVARMRPAVKLLSAIAPQGPYFPDFLTPLAAADGLEAGLEAIRRTPAERIRHELRTLDRTSPRSLPGWVSTLAGGSVVAIEAVATALDTFHETAVARHRSLIRASVDADLAHRTRAMLSGGVDGLFHSLRPLAQWHPPVLEVRYAVDADLHLDGRGLRLVPSFFCHGSPVSLADPRLPPVLVYPIATEHRWPAVTATCRTQPLARLMGATRAGVLDAIAGGATTTELSRIVNTSAASISRHTAVLHDAGLIVSHRHGPTVLHSLTSLGVQLLECHAS
jgi:DNA-binding transcriptional ArsR family regulator